MLEHYINSMMSQKNRQINYYERMENGKISGNDAKSITGDEVLPMR